MLPSTVLATMKSSSCVPYCCCPQSPPAPCLRRCLMHLVTAITSSVSLVSPHVPYVSRCYRYHCPVRLIVVASCTLSPLPCAFRPHHLMCPIPVAPLASSLSPHTHHPYRPVHLIPITLCAPSPSPHVAHTHMASTSQNKALDSLIWLRNLGQVNGFHMIPHLFRILLRQIALPLA